MNRTRHYYKVTGKKLTEFLVDWHERYYAALEDVRKFSRRVGGHRKNIATGMGWGDTHITIVFTNPPDKALWKKSYKDSEEYWEPKRNKAAKVLREEFEKLEKAIPTRGELDDFVKFQPFGGNTFVYHPLGAEKFDKLWVVSLPDYYELPKGVSLKRISDLTFEKLQKDKGVA